MSIDLARTVAGAQDGRDTVVLLGSLGSNRSMWNPQIEALADGGLHVIAFEHRGHGDSPTPPGPYSVDDLATDVLSTLGALGVERFHLVGLSLGGAAKLSRSGIRVPI